MPGMGRVGRLAVGIVGVLVIIAAIAYAVKPDKPVKDAGQVYGFTPAPTVTDPVALWIGDSYTAGTGASSPEQSEACLTSDKLGWSCVQDAEGGTGFVADGHGNAATNGPLLSRLVADKKSTPHPSVIVLDAGRNDGSASAVKGPISAYADALTKAYPGVPVVVVAPYFMRSQPSDLQDVRNNLRDVAQSHGWKFIDPLSAGWINAQSAKLVIADDVHPDPAGHAYIAAHLAPAISQAVPQVHPVTSAPTGY